MGNRRHNILSRVLQKYLPAHIIVDSKGTHQAMNNTAVSVTQSKAGNCWRNVVLKTNTSFGNITRRTFHKSFKIPSDYNGTQYYLEHFERFSVVNCWSQEEAAVFPTEGHRGEARKVLNGMSGSSLRLQEQLLTNWSFGSLLKNSVSSTRRVCITVSNWKTCSFQMF